MLNTFIKKEIYCIMLFVISIIYSIVNNRQANIPYYILLLLIFTLSNYIFNYRKKSVNK